MDPALPLGEVTVGKEDSEGGKDREKGVGEALLRALQLGHWVLRLQSKQSSSAG